MDQLEKKRQYEKDLVEKMIGIYCKGNHKTKTLCKECERLKDYAFRKIDRCPFMETKTFCSACKVHCYEKEMREQIRDVMRYSGKRMLFSYPKETFYHLYITLREKLHRR